MVTIIQYNDIKSLPPLEVAELVKNCPKYCLDEVRVEELLNRDVLLKPITDEVYLFSIYKKGIYLLFDEDNDCRYVGQTEYSFFQRFMGQLDTNFKAGFGFNSVLRKMGGRRKDVHHNELTTEDHNYDYEILIKYKLVLIEVPDNMTQHNTYLERLLMKAFRELNETKLLNSRIGWLADWHYNTPICEILN